MIKTEHHGMIEPRVGMIVGGSGKKFVLDEHKIKSGVCVFENTHYTMKMITLDRLTLLHVPFQVGDEVMFTWNTTMVDIITEIDWSWFGNDKLWRARLKGRSGTTSFNDILHKNPAWHDHSEYKNGG